MDTKELDRIYIELQKRCDSRRITKEHDPDRVSYIDESEKYLLDFPDRLKKDNPWFWR